MTSVHGPYDMILEFPKGMASATKQLLESVFQELNEYPATPVRFARWTGRASEYCSQNPKNKACGELHSLLLHPADIYPGYLPTLVHEMGHAVHSSRFKGNSSWSRVFEALLPGKNYEIIDDSNYIPCSPDSPGHPYSNEGEAFASAFFSYYLGADTFRNYLESPSTPEIMKAAGALAWTFMRDQVFNGKVFTKDGKDPLAPSSFQKLLAEWPSSGSSDYCSALQDPEPLAQLAAAGRLFDRLLKEDQEAFFILLGFKSLDPAVQTQIEEDLARYVRDMPKLRSWLVDAMAIDDETTRVRAVKLIPADPSWEKIFQDALQDKFPEVRRLAAEKLKKISPSP
ncbi:hypothetical protein FBR05_13225 [Deltaproteobacteria bacterium PRO3]|nr:hypothetical protein [Deltaproteobacteria bacterium PRO3]